MQKKLIILDRDGVINQDSDDYIKSTAEWIPLDGSIEAIATLSKAGYQVAIATNQSGIARQYFNLSTLEAMHEKMCSLVNAAGGTIDYIAFCPHGPDDQCQCRKPKPGLMFQIADALDCTLTQDTLVVGDSLRDLEAGLSAGCTPVLVKTGKGMKSFVKLKDAQNSHLKDIAVYNSLSDVVDMLVN